MSDLNCPSETNIDLPTPLGMPLSMFYKNSFAYETVKKRWPSILKKIIDNIEKDTESIVEKFGEDSRNDIAIIIRGVKQIIDEIENNQELTRIDSSKPDIELWNRQLILRFQQDGRTTYFTTMFLFCECYIYRRLNSIMENTSSLKNYDPFRNQKKQEFFSSFLSITEVAKYLHSATHSKFSAREVKENFIKLLKLSLWSNKCDLSLSLGHALGEIANPFDLLQQYEENILVNESERVWNTISCPKLYNNAVGIIFDNSGYELFLDYCLADFMISYGLAEKIYFYPKAMPWYISDVTKFDAEWMVRTMIKSDNRDLQKLGKRWQNYFDDCLWRIIVEDFWTTPLSYYEMERYDKYLYDTLAFHKLLIFKGDLNYRKLVGDINWYPSTPFHDALQGFHPTNLCSLRTVKCDCIAGVSKTVYERIEEEDPRWKLSGNYALIQYDGNF